jgi:ubiquitin carboxyl-terminal hydrolase 4/11/15
MPLKPTGRRVYEEVWALASNILKKSSIYHDKRNRWWELPNWEEKYSSSTKDDTFKPFVLKIVDRTGYCCSLCNWMDMCSGCLLPPCEEFIEDFFKKMHIAVEWHSSLIEEDYDHEVSEVINHSSTLDKDIQDDGHINLEDCLKKFHEVEEISTNEHIMCSNCKKPQVHLKQLSIYRNPPILIVQLKRFKFSNNFRNKLTTLVEFPFYNLDLSSFMSSEGTTASDSICMQYDLYGIINHYGSLGFGHYISTIKNFDENQWYQYDDSHRSQISED